MGPLTEGMNFSDTCLLASYKLLVLFVYFSGLGVGSWGGLQLQMLFAVVVFLIWSDDLKLLRVWKDISFL